MSLGPRVLPQATFPLGEASESKCTGEMAMRPEFSQTALQPKLYAGETVTRPEGLIGVTARVIGYAVPRTPWRISWVVVVRLVHGSRSLAS